LNELRICLISIQITLKHIVFKFCANDNRQNGDRCGDESPNRVQNKRCSDINDDGAKICRMPHQPVGTISADGMACVLGNSQKTVEKLIGSNCPCGEHAAQNDQNDAAYLTDERNLRRPMLPKVEAGDNTNADRTHKGHDSGEDSIQIPFTLSIRPFLKQARISE